MDEASLPDIASLLTGATGASTRAATCAAVAACCTPPTAAPLRHLIGTTSPGETILRRLLVLCADPPCARLALSALVNLSEDPDAAACMTRAGAVERAADALLSDEQCELGSLYAGLLSNLTRFPGGVAALVGKGGGESAAARALDRLLRLVARIDRMSNVLWMANACSTAEGRAALLIGGEEGVEVEEGKQPLTWLMRLLAAESEATRLAAASALRNCAMAEDCHAVLVGQTNAIGTCLSRLMSARRPVAAEDVRDGPREVREVAMQAGKAVAEPLAEIRLILVEALLLLCKTRRGREALRERAAYPVLDAWKEVEDEKEIAQAVESILDRLAVGEEDGEGDALSAEGLANGTSIVQTAG